MTKRPIILAIESSCDDTSAAILKGQKILSNEIANQEIHSLYGGVAVSYTHLTLPTKA